MAGLPRVSRREHLRIDQEDGRGPECPSVVRGARRSRPGCSWTAASSTDMGTRALYDVDTSNVTTMYYAPYMGQANVGERINADQAMASLRYVIDAVGQHTRNRLFIDQFNVVFNTPGFDRHARIKDTELAGFLDRAAPYLAVETLGYGLWSYKGYYRNLFYNPRFELGLSGWEAEGAVQSIATGSSCRRVRPFVRPSESLS